MSRPTIVDHPVALPADWRAFHLDNVSKLDRDKVLACVEAIKEELLKPTDQAHILECAKDDPEWWIEHHHTGMMQFRNALRGAGFGEEYFGIDNLDDYAVGLIEVALGITALPAR
jgi:hypothetical protein